MQESFNRPTNTALNAGDATYRSSGFFGLNIKTVITIFVVLETLTAGILFGCYLYFFDTIANSLGADNAQGKAIAAFLLGIVSYLLWKTFFVAYTTLNFIKNNGFSEISANRYLFVALSLSLGGMWTPFILTALPNTNVQSTINPRYFLVKTYGVISAAGGLIALAVYFLALSIGINGLNSGIIFQAHTVVNTLTIVAITLALSLSLFGFLSIGLWNQGKRNNFDVQATSPLFKIVSTVWLAIVSAEVFLTLVYAIVRFLGLLSQTFNFIGQSQGTSGIVRSFLLFPILMINIMFQLLYVFWISYIVYQTIKGLWKPQVSYRTFESLARFKENRTKISG